MFQITIFVHLHAKAPEIEEAKGGEAGGDDAGEDDRVGVAGHPPAASSHYYCRLVLLECTVAAQIVG